MKKGSFKTAFSAIERSIEIRTRFFRRARRVGSIGVGANLVRKGLRYGRAAHHHFYLIADACGFERLDDVFLVHHRGRQKRRQADDVRIVVFDGLYHLFRVASSS